MGQRLMEGHASGQRKWYLQGGRPLPPPPALDVPREPIVEDTAWTSFTLVNGHQIPWFSAADCHHLKSGSIDMFFPLWVACFASFSCPKPCSLQKHTHPSSVSTSGST